MAKKPTAPTPKRPAPPPKPAHGTQPAVRKPLNRRRRVLRKDASRQLSIFDILAPDAQGDVDPGGDAHWSSTPGPR